uniref:Uncharacterized protein n=1 Tax=Romanomermis culicivorax TaxID=13658 RepID=A0A915JU07_ROMCU
MFVFETFIATREDWTALLSLVDSEHTIVVSFDGAEDWGGIYTLLGTQFRTDRQQKDKDLILKAIHFDVYRAGSGNRVSPEKRTLKATVSAMWGLDVLKLTLRFPAALRFFNNQATLFLQLDILP